MKKVMVLVLTIALGYGAHAQAKINRSGAFRSVSPRTTVVAVAPILPYYGMGFGSRFAYRYSPFYSPFYDPFYAPPRYESTPSKLDLEIEDIRNEFDYRIDTVKDDKTLSKQDRKQRVRELKHQRDDAIIDAKKKFYNNRSNGSN